MCHSEAWNSAKILVTALKFSKAVGEQLGTVNCEETAAKPPSPANFFISLFLDELDGHF